MPSHFAGPLRVLYTLPTSASAADLGIGKYCDVSAFVVDLGKLSEVNKFLTLSNDSRRIFKKRTTYKTGFYRW